MLEFEKIDTCDDWFGFNISKACEHLGGAKAEVSYIGTVDGPKGTIALFHSKNPDRSRGHKNYPFLFTRDTRLFVGAFDDMQDLNWQSGILCHNCKTAIYSCNRRDYRSCKCGKCHVDGGKSYLKISGEPSDYTIVNINLLTNGIVEDK